MKIEIIYPASVRNANESLPVSQNVLAEIGKMEHLNANISEFFERDPEGIVVSGGGIKFNFQSSSRLLTTIAVYQVDAAPNTDQMDVIVSESNIQIDCGYYGDDGWFVDIEDGSYYIQLWDKSKSENPIAINEDDSTA